MRPRRALFDQAMKGARFKARQKPKATHPLIRQLVAALRQQAGINVRLPSHHQPPFRATQWLFTGFTLTLVAGATSTFNLSFTGPSTSTLAAPEPFPQGHLGALTYLRTWAWSDTVAILGAVNTRSTLFKNGARVPGFDTVVGGGSSNTAGAGAGIVVQIEVPTLVPVHLVPDDQLILTVANVSAVTVLLNVVVGGWLYPARRDERSIFGTLVD